jgi:fluoride exporter
MQKFLFLSLGAIAGAGARYGIGVWFSGWASSPPEFPWPTFLINISGSLLLGFFMRYMTGVASSPEMRIMLTTGFCGAYTTMSTFSYEFMTLMQQRRIAVAGLYMFGTAALAPLACLAGFMLAEYMLS